MKIDFVCKTLDDTKNLAQKFAKLIKNDGCFISLYGEIGAGKTAFVKEVASAIGVTEKVTSPSFVILNEYHSADIPIYHFDLYRLEGEEEVVNIGFEEIIDDKNAIKFIEWPEKAKAFMPKNCKKITIVKLGKKSRNRWEAFCGNSEMPLHYGYSELWKNKGQVKTPSHTHTNHVF